MLNDFFCSVCTVDNGIVPHIDSLVGNGATLDYVTFDEDAVLTLRPPPTTIHVRRFRNVGIDEKNGGGLRVKSPKKLKANSSSGPDGLPPVV